MAHVYSMTAAAESMLWYCALLMALMLVLSCCDNGKSESGEFKVVRMRNQDMNRPCDYIYFVREGETLQTIAEKCGDPYIIEERTHIYMTPTMFSPGLVIKINPFNRM